VTLLGLVDPFDPRVQRIYQDPVSARVGGSLWMFMIIQAHGSIQIIRCMTERTGTDSMCTFFLQKTGR
jgi:hypothetical protein